MFGESAIGDMGHAGENSVAGMPDATEICGCNGVCKGTIVKAIREQGLFTVDEVKKHTKAASSCGSCTGLVEQILISCVGGAADIKPKSEKAIRSEEHTSELQSLMRNSYAVFCLKKKQHKMTINTNTINT